MLCERCRTLMRKFGHNESGSQRYRCDHCRHTFTDHSTLAIDHRRTSPANLLLCLQFLLEGTSVSTLQRIYHIHRNTIINKMVTDGVACKAFLKTNAYKLTVENVEIDEIWSFVNCKEKTRIHNGYGAGVGDAWCFTAIERDTKFILAWHLGGRTPKDTLEFARKLRDATRGRFQLTTDGFRPYLVAIPAVFGSEIDYASLVKIYGNADEDHRYSPGIVTGVTKTIHIGDPDEKTICTSFVERHNRTIRMQNRRLTRLTDAHSKKWENHEASLALFFAFYNFCRKHSTLKTTPAVKMGLTDHVWSVQELLEKAKLNM